MINNKQIFSKFEVLGLAIFTLLILSLGMIGFDSYYSFSKGISLGLSDIFYKSLNLFLVQFALDHGPFPIELELARWLAPLIVSYALVKTVMGILGSKVNQFKIGRLKEHTIIFGLNSNGIALVENLIEQGKRVVVISIVGNKYISRAHQIGASVLTGNLADESLLFNANITHAKTLIAASYDDSLNINLVHHAFNNRTNNPILKMLKVVVYIGNMELASVLNGQSVFVKDYNNFSATLFHQRKSSARWLINEFGPDKFIQPQHNVIANLTILLTGDDSLITDIIWRLASVGFYGQQKLTIVVTGIKACEAVNVLLTTQPIIAELIDIKKFESDIGVFNAETSSQIISDTNPNIAYVASESSECTMITLKGLENTKVNIPIIVCELADDIVLKRLKLDYKGNTNILFAPVKQAMGKMDTVLQTKEDILASEIHNKYVRSQLKQEASSSSNSSLQKWQLLPESLKDANRNQADHLHIKCRLIVGKQSYNEQDVRECLSPELVEAMAIIEHQRWVAAKRIDGWRFIDGQKDIQARLSPCIVEWCKLDELEKQKDRDAVINIPELVSLELTIR